MKYKGVEGGTPSGVPLCKTCRNATYVRGKAESQVLLYCAEISGFEMKNPLPFEAYECSQYDDKRMPSRRDMDDTAWILRTNPKQKGTLGFFSPKQMEEWRKEGKIGDDE